MSKKLSLENLKLRDHNSVRLKCTLVHAQMTDIFSKLDVPNEHSKITADVLTSASLRGVDTHGVGKLTGYAKAILSGKYTIPQSISISTESNTTALISCGNGLGFVGAHTAMEMSIDKATKCGIGMVAVKDGHHVGMVGYYPMMALKHGMVGIAATNASRSVHPALGVKPLIGTNPIAFAAPAGRERDFVLDMATSTVASGKIGLAKSLGVKIPSGWVVDSEGDPISEPPNSRHDGWSLTPLGGTVEQGSHKGYGLALVIDILCGILSGGGFGAQLNGGENMAWTMAIDISRFRKLDEFKSMMDEMIKTMHSTPSESIKSPVLVPGDPEWDTYDDRKINGIPVEKGEYAEIVRMAEFVGSDVII